MLLQCYTNSLLHNAGPLSVQTEGVQVKNTLNREKPFPRTTNLSVHKFADFIVAAITHYARLSRYCPKTGSSNSIKVEKGSKFLLQLI